MSVVPLYSIGKPFTAAAALLSLPHEATLGELVPGLALALRPLPLLEVLAHRAGLNDYAAWPDYTAAVEAREPAWPDEAILARATVTDPGRFAYSNIGYLLVRLALEHHHGERLHDVLTRLVLEPLGLDLLPFAEPGDWAACTDPSIDEHLRAYDPAWVYPGSLAGEPREAARGLAGLMAGTLGADVPRLMARGRAVRAPGHPWGPHAGYGLGLMTGGDPVSVVGHGGGGPGFDLFAACDVSGTSFAGAALPGAGRSEEVTLLALDALGTS